MPEAEHSFDPGQESTPDVPSGGRVINFPDRKAPQPMSEQERASLNELNRNIVGLWEEVKLQKEALRDPTMTPDERTPVERELPDMELQLQRMVRERAASERAHLTAEEQRDLNTAREKEGLPAVEYRTSAEWLREASGWLDQAASMIERARFNYGQEPLLQQQQGAMIASCLVRITGDVRAAQRLESRIGILDNKDVAADLALAYVIQGKYDDAEKQLIFANRDAVAKVWGFAVWEKLRFGDHGAAVEILLKRGNIMFSNDSPLYITVGEALALYGGADEFLATFKAASKDQIPQKRTLYQEIALAQARMGRKKEAGRYAKELGNDERLMVDQVLKLEPEPIEERQPPWYVEIPEPDDEVSGVLENLRAGNNAKASRSSRRAQIEAYIHLALEAAEKSK